LGLCDTQIDGHQTYAHTQTEALEMIVKAHLKAHLEGMGVMAS